MTPSRHATTLVVTASFALLTGCVSAPVQPPEVVVGPSRPAPVITPPNRRELPSRLLPVAPELAGFDAALPAQLDSIMRVGLAEGAAPGAAIAVGRFGRLVMLKGYGSLAYAPGAEAVTSTTVYDLASLTKIVVTTTSAMILEETGRLQLDRTVASYVPELNAPDKAVITVRMLLTHSGGFEAYAPLYHTTHGRSEYLAAINSRPLAYAPGTRTIYSDWDMVLLQAVIERITGTTLDQFADGHFLHALGMLDTHFNPDTTDAGLRARIAPTAYDSMRGFLRGSVHDANAWAIGGVSGHAGLFSTARDLAIFAQMMLNGGTYDDIRILAPQTIARWTARQGGTTSRALGWDTPAPGSSAGRFFSPRSFGHTGFTGTSLWIDPERSLFVVLLMNRVNSHGEATRHVQLRRDVADAVQHAIVDAPLVNWEALR